MRADLAVDCTHENGGKTLFAAGDYISGEQFVVRKCSGCHLVYTDLSSADRAAVDDRYYPAAYYGEEKRYSRLLSGILNGLVKRRVSLLGEVTKRVNGAVLDIGCGQGFFLQYFVERGWHAVGLEVSSLAAYHAKEVLGLEVFVGADATKNLESGSFDVIGLWHVLEHVERPKSMLCEARRLLKDDGKMLLSVPNWGSLEARIGKDKWFHLDVPRHVSHFTEHSLIETLNATGWEIARKTYYTPEYDFFSFVQTAQNLCRLDMNLLYRMIRSGELSTKVGARVSIVQKALAIASLPLLAVLSLAYVPAANMVRQGSTVNLILKKKTCSAEKKSLS